MGFFDSLYQNTIGKVVSTAQNLWTAGTAPTESRFLWDAAGETAKKFEGLQSPATHVATEKAIAQSKTPAAIKALTDKTTKEIQSLPTNSKL
jgi:hypothetical protein